MFKDKNSFTIEDAEDIILGMAEVVYENRSLRQENKELKKYKKKYEDELDARFKAAQQSSVNILNALLVGHAAGTGKQEDLEFAKKLCK